MTNILKYIGGFKGNGAVGVVAVTLALSASQLGAVPITGEIHFGGGFTPIDGGGSQVALGSATGIDFINPGIVTAATGDFASLTPFVTPANFTDFQFSPLTPSPVDPLWVAGGFSFTMTAVQVTFQSNAQLSLLGIGYISAAGYDPTPGDWNFTGNASSSLFTFSANSEARNAVPDGGNTLLLLGAALLGMGFIASRISQAKPRLF